VVLLGFRKGSQYPTEKVGASLQTLSLFGCWCLGAYSLVAGAAGQKIILADFREHRCCTSYIAAMSRCCMLATSSYVAGAGMQSYR
jgi:hypothetical protein